MDYYYVSTIVVYVLHMCCVVATRARVIDKCVWRCPAGHETTMRLNSIFAQSHLYIQDILHFIFTYAEGLPLYKCAKSTGINYKATAVDWAKIVRQMFVEYDVSDTYDVKFSGIVEIDKSLFSRKVKYNKGNARGMKVWIFGMGERNSNRLNYFQWIKEIKPH